MCVSFLLHSAVHCTYVRFTRISGPEASLLNRQHFIFRTDNNTVHAGNLFFANVGLLRVYAKFSVDKYHGLPTRVPFHATAGAHKSTWGDRPFLFHSLKVVVVSIYGGVPVAIAAAMAFVDICPPPTMVFVLLLCLGWIWALVWRQLKTKEQLWFSVNYFNMTRSDDPKTSVRGG